jgi:hypothetical protein
VKLLVQPTIEGVEDLRAVQGDGRYATVSLEEDGFVHAASFY